MPARAILTLAVLALIGCANTPSQPSGDGPFAAVHGHWVYSHLGQPTIDILDGQTTIENTLKRCEISISESGKTSLRTQDGGRMKFTLQVAEDTDKILRLEATEGEESNWIYDKETDRLIMPMSLMIEDAEGTIPAYFARLP